MDKTDGQIAYDAYCQAASGRSLITDDELPEYGSLHPEIKAAWEAAGNAVRRVCTGEG